MATAERYCYAVARLRAMESRLLDDSVLQRLIDCEDLDSAMKILGETVYSSWLVELKSNTEFDKAIESELLYIYNEVKKFVPDSGLVEICRLPYDFHNVKVLLKGQILQREGGERHFELLTALANIPTDDLIMAVETEDYRLLPYDLHSVLPKSFALWDQTRDILEVERLLDNVLFREMFKIARSLEYEAPLRWVRGKVDAENVRNMFRLKRMDKDAASVQSYLHDGGFVSVEQLLSMLSEPIESWVRVLSYADIGRVLYHVQDGADMNALLVEMEKILDDYVTSILQTAKYSAFAPENVLNYLWHKEMEAKNVRVALVSVANAMDKDLARRLMRRG
ncbi:V-type ATPase subunit [Aminobacterium mobile]|jgi:V/A-type H+-transporting ATPase subunit C|uniref:V-type ATPase subunit n=1 Tax=Aminobacterium mobile TaxID=81467 RepID=UPI000465E7A7|nr:V-type ATPase subunit [Aminobacterium mobile]